MRNIGRVTFLTAICALAVVALPNEGLAVCGDGIIEASVEQCDDGNTYFDTSAAANLVFPLFVNEPRAGDAHG